MSNLARIRMRFPAFGAIHFSERHDRVIDAGAAAVLDAVGTLQVTEDPLIRAFLALRELPARIKGGKPVTPFGLDRFTPLGREGNECLWYGLAGEFWKTDFGLRNRDIVAGLFHGRSVDCPLLLLEFTTEALSPGRCRLVTRTRIFCPDPRARRFMTLYWFCIRPASGLIRRRILKQIARRAETDGAGGSFSR